MTSPIVPLVMAGGAGTRLWPLSRDTLPKQFIPLLADGLSTFQATLLRLADPRFDTPIIVTNSDFRFIAAEQMLAIGIAGEIVLEPERRDSAPAIAVGTVLAGQRRDGAICAAFAADHVILDVESFRADCALAASHAATGLIMTLGIPPDHPATGYGYIARFVEKPDAATAAGYLAEGYLWNSGNFLFPVATMREELARHAPAVLSAAEAAVSAARRDLDFLRLDPAAFAGADKISIDYAVMERTASAGVVEARFDWSDVGSWDSIHALKPQDASGNVLEGEAVALDTRGSYVRSDGTLTTVLGLDDVVVVSTRDAVLVAAKSQAGKVKTLVERMKADGRPEASEHLRMYRPWGWYQRVDIGSRFQVKRIHVKPGAQLSLQKHFHRAEHWVVVSGTAAVTVDGTTRTVHENESAYLPIGCTHRLANPGKIPLELIEVQVGSYTGEDDIIRIEDDYARS